MVQTLLVCWSTSDLAVSEVIYLPVTQSRFSLVNRCWNLRGFIPYGFPYKLINSISSKSVNLFLKLHTHILCKIHQSKHVLSRQHIRNMYVHVVGNLYLLGLVA